MYWLDMEIYSFQLILSLVIEIAHCIVGGSIQGSLTDCELLLNVQNRQTALFSAMHPN